MMASLPVEVGAVHDTATLLLLKLALAPVGAPGAVVVAAEKPCDVALVPTALVAVTV
jgi:hypothetical protein